LSSLVTSGVLGKVSGDTSLPCMGCRLGKQIQLPYPASQTVSLGLLSSSILMYGALLPSFRKGASLLCDFH
jgi:hypothetical protein